MLTYNKKENRFARTPIAKMDFEKAKGIYAYCDHVQHACRENAVEKLSNRIDTLEKDCIRCEKAQKAGLAIDYEAYEKMTNTLEDLREKYATEKYMIDLFEKAMIDAEYNTLDALSAHAYYGITMTTSKDGSKCKVSTDKYLSRIDLDDFAQAFSDIVYDAVSYVGDYDGETDWDDERKERFTSIREGLSSVCCDVLEKEHFSLSSKNTMRLLNGMVDSFRSIKIKENGSSYVTLKASVIKEGYSLLVTLAQAIVYQYGRND